jgi:hypothetical protein
MARVLRPRERPDDVAVQPHFGDYEYTRSGRTRCSVADKHLLKPDRRRLRTLVGASLSISLRSRRRPCERPGWGVRQTLAKAPSSLLSAPAAHLHHDYGLAA